MEVVVDRTSEEVQLEWKDIGVRRYPFVWLRDCCQCFECFHPDAKCRKKDFAQLDLNATPKTVQSESNGDVRIEWTDGHVSVFERPWLKDRAFDGVDCIPGSIPKPERPFKLWGAELINTLTTMPFESILSDDSALFKWITVIERTGLCLLTDAPVTNGQINRIADRVAYLRKIHYGETFQVATKVVPSNIAYTSRKLPLHTDTPYLYHIPGIQMLHCIRQCTTEGGENQFVDGFHVAEQLRQLHPDFFQILSSTKVDFYDVGADYLSFHMRARNRTIEVDEDGNVVRITFSNHARDSILRLPPDKVKPFYKALRIFYDLLCDPKNIIQLKMKPGDIVCFHNDRVLHGRSGFGLAAGERHLEGGYLDWDETRSRRRVLQQKLNINNYPDYY